MAKNYVSDGRYVTVTAVAAVSSGDGVLIGNLFGVAQKDAAIGEDFVIDTKGIYDLPCLSTDDISVGEALYWDDGNSRLTVTATANYFVGVGADASGSGDATVQLRLNGSAPKAAG